MVCKIFKVSFGCMLFCFFFSGIVVAQTTTDPDEILTKDPNDIADSLERAQAKGKIVACADPYGYPYGHQNMNPPGFDVEIMEALAARGDMRLEMYWADTGTRGRDVSCPQTIANERPVRPLWEFLILEMRINLWVS